MSAFIRHVTTRDNQCFSSYVEFERYAAEHYAAFWDACLDWFDLPVTGSRSPICTSAFCEDASFFPCLRLNYAECLLTGIAPQAIALMHCREDGHSTSMTGAELRRNVTVLAEHLRDTGIKPGDRVAALARNTPELIIAALATATVGAIFLACSAEMPIYAVIERLAPVRPSVLFAVSHPKNWELGADIASKIRSLVDKLEGLRLIVALDDTEMPRPERNGIEVFYYKNILSKECPAGFVFERFPFNHPLFILFSSGTTGLPKAIVHGAGGTLLEHCKEHRLHCDFRRGDKLFYQTSCAWMMWNWQLSALASGVEIVTYDGPVQDPNTIWSLISQNQVTAYGTSATYIQYCANLQCEPRHVFDLTSLRVILSTGSKLQDYLFDWVIAQVKRLPVQSISGGTEVIGCLVLGNPNLPVCRGEIQCASLGLDIRCIPLDNMVENIGELACANPFPSKPLGFWEDKDGSRFHQTYFSQHPPLWTHGDIIELMASGGFRIHGRSDGIIKIGGVRVGPAEILNILVQLPEIEDVLPVAYEEPAALGGIRLVLLIILSAGINPADIPVQRIRKILISKGGSHMIPFRLFVVTEFPRTFNGKTSHFAAQEVVNGRLPKNQHALVNPESIHHIEQATRALRGA